MKTRTRFFAGFILAGLFAGAMNASGFIPVKGTYNGIFFEDGDYWQQSSGAITIQSTARGKYSARLQLGKERYSFSGRFDPDGWIIKDIFRRYQTPLLVRLQVSANDVDLIEGTVSDGVWTAALAADRAVFNGRSSVSPDRGRYTMILFGDPGSATTPGGHSYGTVKIDRAGRIAFAGSLADGRKLTRSSTVSKDGYWPLFAPLYGGLGSLYGWMRFNASIDEEVSGDVTWVKPQRPWDWYYPGGFAVVLEADGSRYTRPAKTTPVIDVADAAIEFNGGDLYQNFTNHVFLDSKNRITNLSGNGLRMSFTLSNGSFRGRVMDPITWEWIPFRGVVLQRYAVAAGYFPGWDETGEVWLEAW